VLLRTQRHVAAKVGTSKGGGKQWQTTPKNLPRMRCAKSHIGSITGLWFLPDRPLGLNIYIYITNYVHESCRLANWKVTLIFEIPAMTRLQTFFKIQVPINTVTSSAARMELKPYNFKYNYF